ncbi:GDSL-type esterase/lipase family protein [Tuanshanicoccus lijuaniae]|uniref:GDSL-type esterase/lipase family protein n=1 Tax=Aerococcaceae bacterium zg-1292 TaxID=2774330 RepID=UPI001BD9031D|nr:lipase [Aerococcaceae bacterium zg-A91]MBS4457520.1 lipase [Aerococcaceae bacterium zg-BR33]
MIVESIIKEMMNKEQQNLLVDYQFLNQQAVKGQILFTGSSLMEQFPINELAMTHGLGKIIYNRGVGGFTTAQFLENIETLALDLEATKIFINIGTNDIKESSDGLSWQESLTMNYREILNCIKTRQPSTQIYVMAYYPMDEGHPVSKHWPGFSRTNAKIQEANRIVEQLADEFDCVFINVNNGLADANGNLYRNYTKDGIHLYAEAYEIVYRNVEKYL